MKAYFRGDIGTLRAWAKKAQRYPTDALDYVSLQLAEEAVNLVRGGISDGKDPDGKRYKRLALRKGQPLRKSGRLQASWHRKQSDRRGFSIAASANYAIYHQVGTGIYGPRRSPIKPVRAKALSIPTPGGTMFRRSVKGIPPRRMVPHKGLSAPWRRAFQETAKEALAEYFGT